jgi:hypothetical protein
LEAAADELGFERRDHVIIFDPAEHVEGEELISIEGDLVAPVDDVLDDGTEFFDVRVLTPEGALQ